MQTQQRSPILTLLLTVLIACGPAQTGDQKASTSIADSAQLSSDTAPPAAVVARARSAADGLGKDLQSRLFAALDSAGPAYAMTYCADSAQALSARHASEGVYIRRVSLRVRNTANRPDSAEASQLRRLDSLKEAGALPVEVVRMVRLATGEPVVEYLRPIVAQERCLACHGSRNQLAPAVRTLLDTRYPDDQATGYQAGDLRGMISVRVRP
jgi:hypothetical protein